MDSLDTHLDKNPFAKCILFVTVTYRRLRGNAIQPSQIFTLEVGRESL